MSSHEFKVHHLPFYVAFLGMIYLGVHDWVVFGSSYIRVLFAFETIAYFARPWSLIVFGVFGIVLVWRCGLLGVVVFWVAGNWFDSYVWKFVGDTFYITGYEYGHWILAFYFGYLIRKSFYVKRFVVFTFVSLPVSWALLPDFNNLGLGIFVGELSWELWTVFVFVLCTRPLWA